MSMPQEQALASGFWEARTGWSRLKQLLFLEPLPGGARWSAAFGSLLLFVFALQVITGILLSMNYAPSVETAWPSVKYIQDEARWGAFIRGIHHWGSSAMVVLLMFHLVQVFVWGAYKKPRELTWMVGVVLLVGVLGLAFTGYLLPWDQKAYWATKVGLGIASTTPGIGDDLRVLLQGGPQMGNLTLTRFFTLHGFVLPGLVILLIVVHLYLFRLHGVTPSWWQSAEQLKSAEEPFWPKQVFMDLVLALLFLLGLGLWAYYHPAPLEAQADPSQPYEARPEWYFMFLFQLLRYFEGPYEIVGTFVLPSVFFLILFFWPFLDRSPHRDPRRRPVAMTLLAGSTIGLVALTIYAVATDVRMHEPVLAATRAPVAPAGSIQRADVARLYHSNCVACHGIDGTGSQIRVALPKIPDFSSLAWQLSQTDLEITHRIQDGNEPLMPAYRDKLAPQQMLALTVYIRAFAIGPGPLAQAPPVAVVKPAAPVMAQMSPTQVYRAYCLACHDADGRGNTMRKAMPEIPDFTSTQWQKSRGDAECKQAILEGKGKFMISMKDKLGPSDVDQMLAYVRAFREGKQVVKLEPQELPLPPSPIQPAVVPGPKPIATLVPSAPSAETAARLRVASGLYRQYCLICHGADGKGADMKTAMPTISDFTRPAWHDSITNPAAVVSILDGKGVLMPSFRGRINDEQTEDLVAYLRAFGPARAPAAVAAPTDFEQHYRELQQQWDELQRQLQDLSKRPRKK